MNLKIVIWYLVGKNVKSWTFVMVSVLSASTKHSRNVVQFEMRLFLVSHETFHVIWTSFSCTKPQGWFQIQSLLALQHWTSMCDLETVHTISPGTLSLNCESPSLILAVNSLQIWSKEKMSAHQVFKHTLATRPTPSWIKAQVAWFSFKQQALWLLFVMLAQCRCCAPQINSWKWT